MRSCPYCQSLFDDNVSVCPHDGYSLGNADPLLGATLDGRYRVDSLIGAGGMGAVYCATQLALKRRVALKFIKTGRASSSAVERFNKEALAVARLKHRNIVAVYDYGVAPEIGAYIAMEYLEGRTLRAEVMRLGCLGVGYTLELMDQVCAAIEYAHRNGVIHRDVKTENVFLEAGEDGGIEVKVLDFGIAKLSDSTSRHRTASGFIIGTPAYMSPEQGAGLPIDGRTDVYSLGCVLFECLTGRPPFNAPNRSAMLAKHLTEPPKRPSQLVPGIPGEVDEVVLRSLAKHASARFASVSALRNALASCRGISARVATSVILPPTPSVVLSGTRFEEPSLAPGNLPAQITRFVGRRRELEQVKRLLCQTRLVTLTGPAGIGKSRLAIQVGHELAGSFADGVWYVDASNLEDPLQLAAALARSLRVDCPPDTPLLDALAAALKTRRALILLDGVESVCGECGVVATTLLYAAESLSLLVTSRDPLEVPGEAIWPVPALALPDSSSGLSRDERNDADAVRLFVDRARLNRPGFEVDDENAATVFSLCRRLDGIPLAIELAAGWIKTMSPQEILERADSRTLLAGGPVTAGGTLLAAIRSTLDMLGPEERHLFERLAVFDGGWDLHAALAVVRPDEGSYVIVDILTRLVNRSLVFVDSRASQTRYRMLEVMRRIALETLAASGQADAVRERFLQWFLNLADEGDEGMRGPRQRQWLRQLEADYGNLRSALRLLAETGQWQRYSGLCAALGYLWRATGRIEEGSRWLQQAADHCDGQPPALQARVYKAAGMLAYYRADMREARRLAERSVELLRSTGDQVGAAEALYNLGAIVNAQSDYDEAGRWYQESLELFRAAGAERGISRALNGLGLLAMDRGETQKAIDFFLEALPIARRVGEPRGTAGLLGNLATAHQQMGDYGAAAAYAQECLEMAGDLGDRELAMLALQATASIERGLGRFAEANAHSIEALRVAHEMGNVHVAAQSLEVLAACACSDGRFERALRLAGAAAAVRASAGIPAHLSERADLDHALFPARAFLGNDAADRYFNMGTLLNLEQAVELARCDTE